MKRRFGLMIFIILTMAIWASMALAAPTHLSSITDNVNHPGRIAIDAQGNLYVTDPADNVLRIYNSKGQLRNSLGVARAYAVAVDQAGRIYVGSEKEKGVHIYNADLSSAGKLGSGEEFARPNDIAIDGSGRIYVVDQLGNVVKVYESTGVLAITIGGAGSDVSFTLPMAVAINDAAGEVYVSDNRPLAGGGTGVSIQVFDKNGLLKRSFGNYGQSTGQMLSPVDIAVDTKSGKLYIVDSTQNAVLIVDPTTGAISGALYDKAKPMATPQGVAIANNGIIYITSYNGKSIEPYAFDGYVTMETSPAALVFVSTQNSANPIAQQTVNVSNTGSGVENWTVTSDKPWIVPGQAAGSTGAASSTVLSVGIDLSKLTPGTPNTYTGNISIISDYGRTDTIAVTLSILPPPTLSLSNGWLEFTAKKDGIAASLPVTVEALNATTLNWTAAGSSGIGITPAAGTTTATAMVSVNTAGFAVGRHESVGYVTFSAPNAVGDGSKITVNLTITSSSKITVNANIAEAKYVLTGPSGYKKSSSGLTWSEEGALAGDYTNTYDAVIGYKRPLPQTKTLATDGEITFTGKYVSWKDLAMKKTIITAKGPGSKNDGLLKTYKSDGTAVAPDFKAMTTKYGASIASGDVDGDGIAEFVVGTGAGSENNTLVRIYKADKVTLLTEFEAFPGMHGGVNVAVADFDGNGTAEVIVAPAGGAENVSTVKIYSYSDSDKAMVPTGIEFTAHSNLSGVNIAAADTDGNFAPRLVTAPASGSDGDAGSVKIWNIDGIKSMGTWTIVSPPAEIQLSNKYGATVAAGDTIGDGKDRIIVGTAADKKTGRSRGSEDAVVKIFQVNADGIVEVNRITVFDSTTGVNVAAADLDGDGIAEIIAGIGAAKSSRESKTDRGTVKVLSAAGALKFSVTPYEDSRDGVKVAVGDMGL